MSDPPTRIPIERLPYRQVLELFSPLGLRKDEVVELLLKSVLITVGQRTAYQDAEVMFSHRLFHEFCIASALAEQGVAPPESAPPEVHEFWTELTATAATPATSGLLGSP